MRYNASVRLLDAAVDADAVAVRRFSSANIVIVIGTVVVVIVDVDLGVVNEKFMNCLPSNHLVDTAMPAVQCVLIRLEGIVIKTYHQH